jgi:cellulose synthase/poly-beta-1,6-N-acetylglucosamine synthase-like glycosyltransferase
MPILAYGVLAIYSAALLFITVYCLMQFNLLYHYRRMTRRQNEDSPVRDNAAPVSLVFAGGFEEDAEEEFPRVTVQLPIFNERYVIERLLDAVAAFDYPRDRFEIQVLDDSTDETVEIVAAKVEELRKNGVQAEQIRRENRKGFKAGALRDATPLARGEFIAIFDADFLPRPDFLLKTIPYFQDPEVGVVQTRWEHINEDYSLITRLQALQLNVHFTVEQVGRMAGNYFLQFNGTAGIWRRETIEDAGGWEADTLTEDLDLSIRAQIRGWKIRFLPGVGSPAELPAEMNSFKSQQFRWMKGGAETARKMLPTVWRSPLNLIQKLQTTMHLLGSTVFVFVFITGLFSVPLLFLLGDLIQYGFSKNFFALFLTGLLSIIAVYYVGNVESEAVNPKVPFWRTMTKFFLLFPLFLSLSMGLSLHNTIAVIQGYIGKKSAFVRTPKFNIQSLSDSFSRNKYLKGKLTWTTVLEGGLALYFLLGGVYGGLYIQNTTFIIFHLMLAVGYGSIFYFTLRHLSLK